MSSITDALQKVDWNFSDSSGSKGIHGIHPYPAKFIPDIPRNLIKLFHPGDNSVILDPFCGSGTTLYEAINMGLDSIGIDLNPIACLIASVKTTPIFGGFENEIIKVTETARLKVISKEVRIPNIPNIDHWFKKDVQLGIAAIIEEINHVVDDSIRNALKLSLSKIIVKVSNQDGETRYAAVDNNIELNDVFSLFTQSSLTTNRLVSSISDDLGRKIGKAKILNKDILTVSPDDIKEKVGLVITSPPYPNAYEYWLYHKYRMYWLGMNPIDVRTAEIGARPHYFKKNHQTEVDFENQMADCFKLFASLMQPNSKACFVIGRSIIHGKEIDNVALLEKAAQRHSFKNVGIIRRTIPSRRKTFNPANGAIITEQLVIFNFEGSK